MFGKSIMESKICKFGLIGLVILLVSCASRPGKSQPVSAPINTSISSDDQFTSIDKDSSGYITVDEFDQIDNTNYIAPIIVFSILMITIVCISFGAAKLAKRNVSNKS